MSGLARRSGVLGGVGWLVGAALLGTSACGAPPDASGSSDASPSVAMAIDSAARAPEGTRVRLEVLNAGGVAGLARRATLFLRDAGYDVVSYGTSADTASGTTIRVTSASRSWGDRVQRALGTGRVEETEMLRYVDVVVLLGRDWTPPAEPLRP